MEDDTVGTTRSLRDRTHFHELAENRHTSRLSGGQSVRQGCVISVPAPKEWLTQAEQYVKNAEHLQNVDTNEAFVQLQQAAEYTLKSVQLAQTGSHQRTHNLMKLRASINVPQQYETTLGYIDQAYRRRYPDEKKFEPSNFGTHKHHVEQLIGWARNIVLENDTDTAGDTEDKTDSTS